MASNGANGSDGAQSRGQITQIIGPVVDAYFAEGEKLPDIYDALEIPLEGGTALVCEVQQQLPNRSVRSVAMSSTDGLRRGMPVIGTGAPIRVPVGQHNLGRIFNVLGRTIDNKGDVEAADFYPIHRLAPALVDQATSAEVFETGIKVIDLIAPFLKGGKTAIFGGAGTGQDGHHPGADPQYRQVPPGLFGVRRRRRAQPRGH